MNKTTHEKINPFLSAMMINDMGLAPIDANTHSNKNIELNIIIKIVGINIIAKINQIVKEATINTLH
jgi:hypothetical protein